MRRGAARQSWQHELGMRRRFGIAVSAMALAVQFGTPLSAAAPTLEELGAIDDLLDANDVEALRAYLLRRPELLEGETVLAQLLRDYLDETSDIASFLGIGPTKASEAFGPDDTDDFEAGLVARNLQAPPELY